MNDSGLFKKDISTRTLLIICFLLTCVKLWFVRAHLMMVTVTPDDDLLFIRLAAQIIQGHWLGPYNQLTLIKEPFYPIFIAISHWLTIPLLVAQQLFYAFACCVFIWAIRPLQLKKYILLGLYIVLLLNPASYNYADIGRVFQLAIYGPEVLILLSCLLAMALRLPNSYKRAVLWAIGLGISMGIFWITRDESIFILPSVLLMLLFLLITFGRKSRKQFAKVLLLCAIPFLLTKGIVNIIETINMHKYGIPYTVELKSNDFRSAYGGLLRIKTDKWREFFPVVKDVREKAYAVSPTFRKVKKYLEGPVGQAWAHLAGDHDIPAAFFIWAFRDSVAEAGYAKSGPMAMAFYKKMGQEINTACDSGKLKCRGHFSSLIPSTALVPTWHKQYDKLVLPTFYSIVKRTVSFDGINASTQGARSSGPADIINLFNAVTGERAIASRGHENNEYHKLNGHIDREKTRILGQIGWLYKLVSPYLFVLSLIVMLWKLLVAVKNRQLQVMTVFSMASLAGIFGICFVMMLVDITSYSEIARIMQVGFPIVLLFIIGNVLDIIGPGRQSPGD